ncbi:MAG: WYL domain-containing protein [Gemmatimonadota bacterium]|nr:WYL domain-containing protein [Gemmatimonadota bacterium]
MAGAISKLQRWLDLIAYLVGRRYPVGVDDVLENVPSYASPTETDDDNALEASRRMFERDKAELRAFGIPIETVEFTVGGAETEEGYRLAHKDFYLPYLRLIEGAGETPAGGPSAEGVAPAGGPEARIRGIPEFEVAPGETIDARDALAHLEEVDASPLAREARSARLKLSFDLPSSRPAPILFVDHPDVDERRDRLRRLTDALMARKRVAFGYHGIYRGEPTEREVDGYGLLYQRGNWYLIGHDHLRDDMRIFRVDRMENVEPNAKKPETSDYEIPADFDLADWRGKEAWELGDEEPIEALVAFRFPRSLWAERNGYGEPVDRSDEEVEAAPPAGGSPSDGAAVRSFEVHQVDPFLRWVLSQAGEAEVLAPPELVRAFRDLARDVEELHRGSP